jgi:RNA polymerase sigma-70 factor (ECF subfamily)
VSERVDRALAEAYRREWGQVVASLIARTGDWDLAEDCAQEAFTRALETWPRDGVPQRPGAWLTATARNRAVDRLRRQAVGAAKLEQVAALDRQTRAGADTGTGTGDRPDEDASASGIRDDRLRLIFTCCHPALGFDARVALALRTLAGLTTAEIARAFLVPEATMAKRLVRAKHKIRVAGIPYRVPPAPLLAERTTAVLGVIYLLFNEGYAATTGPDLVRGRLCDEAVRLAAMVAELMPDHPEAHGLHALLLLQDARRAGRVDATGTLVPLEDQDRSRWDAARIAAGVAALGRALQHGEVGPYQLQAAIAACHATAASAAETDWHQIVELYDQLAVAVPSPVVALNRAVAVAMAEGPAAGLRLVDDLAAAGEPAGGHLLVATRADLLRRSGRAAEAAVAYRQARDLTANEAERRYLTRRLAECTRAS